MNLDTVAIKNIKLLANFDTKLNKFIDVKDKIILEEKEKDDEFENITELSDIEYSLYFSFNHLLTIQYKSIIEDYTRKEIINLMIEAITTIYTIYENTIYDDNNIRIYTMLEKIDELIFNANINYKKHTCYYNIIDYYHYLCNGFNALHQASQEVNNIFHGYIVTTDDEDYSDKEEEEEEEEDGEEDEEEEDEEEEKDEGDEEEDNEDDDKEEKEEKYIGDKIDYEIKESASKRHKSE